MPLRYLSKSKYMRGRQCPRLLWYEVNRPELIPPVSPEIQSRFDMGHQVGDLAKQLYPGGVEIAWDRGVAKAVRDTQDALQARTPIFEATFLFDSPAGPLLSRADVMVPVDGDSWDMVEVKSSNGLKPEHPEDVAFQKAVVEGAGPKLRQCFLMHLNKSYRRSGNLDLESLFEKQELPAENLPATQDIFSRADALLKMLSAPDPPDVDLISACRIISKCDLSHICWSFLPEHNVGHLYYGKDKIWQLLSQGVQAMTDVPEDFPLNSVHRIQVETVRSGKVHVDRALIQKFLDGLEYPLHYMDFETMQTAVPLFDGTGPWQQIPFQYSVHVQDSPGAPLRHYSYLADLEGGARDPRPDFLEGLKGCLGTSGTILAHNADFEKNRLEEACQAFPAYLSWANASVFPRIVDTLGFFRSFAYYHPDQKGSCGLKSVLPAITGQGYDDLAIAGGMQASNDYVSISLGNSRPERIQKMREALEAYCARDTEALALIVERLRALAGKG